MNAPLTLTADEAAQAELMAPPCAFPHLHEDRATLMIQRANACADGYEQIGREFSACVVRGFARDIEAGMPAELYRHFIAEAEQRLASLSTPDVVGHGRVGEG